MVAMVSFVSMLIHVYSIGYMGHDARPRYRFFAYLSLFSFAMLMLVTRRQPGAVVLRLGRRRPLFLPADRLLV